MLFNSLNFALFLPLVFILYWFIANRSLKVQNILLLVASYFFYACWDYRFLFLLIFSSLLDYYSGIRIHRAEKIKWKKIWLWLSILINLGFLGIFKYYNFFSASLTGVFSHFGFHADFWTIKVILPVGISFYTFHGLSYVLDIYRNKINPITNFITYSVFVSFFPLLVAGPIERATHLLPQIQGKREFHYDKIIDGLRQILWGLFKKIVIADGCALYANMIFNHSEWYSGSTLALGALLFSFQIYADFSGYSDIALGTARLFGIELLRNFAFPYFSRDIAEFWRRWHISLSSWFRDYLYIPLGGSKGKVQQKIRNVFIIFLVSGFWHGANWTFLAWGVLHASYFLPLLIANRNRVNIEVVAHGRKFPTFKELFNILLTFGLTVFAWIFFRATSIAHAFSYIHSMAAGFLHESAYIQTMDFILLKIGLVLPLLLVLFIIIEWIGREQQYAIASLGLKWSVPVRWAFYYGLIISMCMWAGEANQFIYFQF
jgi:alginate O-acetyltransferase complex protein AlgI